MLFCVCCHSFRKIICFFYVLSHSSIRYFLYTGSYSPMLFLMSWAMTISCTHSMWAFTLPDTICFLSPETQQYIRYYLYAQVLIPRHNTVCFLCPETQQHIRYSLYAQVLIPRHNTVCFLCPETQQYIHYYLYAQVLTYSQTQYVSYVLRHNSISTTLCMRKCLFLGTICFLCPGLLHCCSICYSLYEALFPDTRA